MQEQIKEEKIETPSDGAYLVPMPVSVPLTSQYEAATAAAPHNRSRSADALILNGASDFWTKTPNVLLTSWWQVFPDSTMTTDEKLNAITRLILFLVVLTYLLTQRTRIIAVGLLTIGAIVVYYYVETKRTVEQFTQQMDARVRDYEANLLKDDGATNSIFDEPKSGNPFSNVLVTDYQYNVHKKPAPPIDSPEVRDKVLAAAKQTVIDLNPTQPDLADKLFKNMGDEWDFEQSMRQFVTQPGTTIPNDQEAFSQFCYGSMVSCKEGNAFACARNNPRFERG
jgi:hypothetical protein